MGIESISALEHDLKASLNSSLIGLAKLAKKSDEEKTRIEELERIYRKAREESWDSLDFMKFIEANTDIDFVLNIDGEKYDFVDIISKTDSLLPSRGGDEQDQWYDWLRGHIELSKDYLKSMGMLCVIGGKHLGGMSRNYFDLTQLRSGMEQVQRTLEALGDGSQVSFTSQYAIQKWGGVYVANTKLLLNDQKKLHKLRESQKGGFGGVIDDLQDSLKKGYLRPGEVGAIVREANTLQEEEIEEEADLRGRIPVKEIYKIGERVGVGRRHIDGVIDSLTKNGNPKKRDRNDEDYKINS